MTHYIISYKGFYYFGYTIDEGSLWGTRKDACLWLTEEQLDHHLKALHVLEDIPKHVLKVERM